ncbi:transcription factor Opi1-domain-containing protein [Spinellus fusiger]|nr:transcription factor Opi1-domain-containing protein [Spinellus fusiger]
MHAGTAAGTTAAVVSEESMKCLRYCLSWLQYATQHIDHQMNILRSLVVALATHPHAHQNTPTHTTHTTHTTNTLSEIKREIIDTLRKVVEVVSKYAGTGLPEQAKASVRGFILALPGRWAVLNAGNQANESKVNETSIRLLNFGGESIEMLQSVSNVFAATIERAELWLERLRGVGVTANHPATTTVTTATTANTTTTTQPPTPPTHTSHDAMDLS